jgi:hypothetical protein
MSHAVSSAWIKNFNGKYDSHEDRSLAEALSQKSRMNKAIN